MADDTYTFEQAHVRLEEIAAQVKKKDTSLEKSLDLLEEGVRLANLCTEQIDHTQWRTAEAEPEAEVETAEAESAAESEAAETEAGAADEVPGGDADETSDEPPVEETDVEAPTER
jgi:exodeoxyribonuclease VII small subunit